MSNKLSSLVANKSKVNSFIDGADKKQNQHAPKEAQKRLNVDVPVSMHKRLKMASAMSGLDIKTIVNEAIESKLKAMEQAE